MDWNDSSMPAMTSEETAIKLKAKIVECRKFLLLATNNALDSKWVPWELGVADNSNGMKNVAIIPVTERQGGWHGSEYIGIYSRIETAITGNWGVFAPGSSHGITLTEWLRT